MINLDFYQAMLLGLLIGGVFGIAAGWVARWMLKG